MVAASAAEMNGDIYYNDRESEQSATEAHRVLEYNDISLGFLDCCIHFDIRCTDAQRLLCVDCQSK